MRKVLVTGSDGFIGSHLVEHLVRNGHSVKAFVYYNSFNSWGWLDRVDSEIKEAIEVFSGDIRDSYGVRKAMQECDSVLHLAALIGIPYSYHSPETYVDTNVKGTLNVLLAARDLELSRVVHTSTSEVYGSAQFVPITEAHPLIGQSPYSATKIGADQLAVSFHRSFDLPVVILRPFNTYGPRQSARAVIPSIITQIAAGKNSLKLGALEPTRDFNYVHDTVCGFEAALRSERAIGQTINLGSNFEISIGETAETIKRLMNSDIEIHHDHERLRPSSSEVERLWCDNTKAADTLGWKPLYSGIDGFERGLQKTIDWFSDPLNLAYYKPSDYNV
jgi:dTDP-glucose 4,6-dehydratase